MPDETGADEIRVGERLDCDSRGTVSTIGPSPPRIVHAVSPDATSSRFHSAAEILRTGGGLEIALVYNATAGVPRGVRTDALSDNDEASMACVVRALESQGHTVRTLGIDYAGLDRVDHIETELVFNFCDGTGVDGHPGVEVVDALERRAIPYSGADSGFYHLTTDKFRMKQRLAAARVPVPLGAVMPAANAPIPAALRYPLFVKPRDGYGSVGVSEGSLVQDEHGLRVCVGALIEELGSQALVEEYIDGREVSVGIIGPWQRPFVLPSLEVCFGRAYDGRPRIRSFETKHDASSPLYHDFRVACPAELGIELEHRVRLVAVRAYRALRGNGYGRVDMRLAADGTPYVLEVNANCSLELGEDDSDCGLMVLMGRAQGWDYGQLLQQLVLAGLAPRPVGRVPAAPRWQDGALMLTSLADFPSGAQILPFGAVHPVAEAMGARRAMSTPSGMRVFVEPHVSCATHSTTPNLVPLADERGALHLTAAAPIARGERLTLDFDRPLVGRLARARACGSRTGARTKPEGNRAPSQRSTHRPPPW
jgi:D-alanine-D-alanine ligase